MAPTQKLDSQPIICRGGLNSNANWLYLNQLNPGIASNLVNFEPSLFGGYRRIDGFTVLESTDSGEVAPSTAEGKIYGLSIYGEDTIIAARKLQSGANYSFFRYVSGSSWTNYTHGLTLSSTLVDKVRSHDYNFDGTEGMIFADGVNGATLFNGTSWIDIGTGDTGVDFANAGGNQALAAPKYVHSWENHLFMAGDSTSPHVVAHSAPNAEYDWTVANGAGQINAGMTVKQIYPFRDRLFVFGEDRIRYIFVDPGGNFLIEDLTSDLGLQGSDTVVEVGGDLLFLGPDGIRPISATERIGDVELASISKEVQQDIKELQDSVSENEIHSVIIKGKSQFRYFFSDTSLSEELSAGLLGGQKLYQEGPAWEFGRLRGIKASCATSRYILGDEYVLHGDHTGKVYRQESGTSFNGANIEAEYSTPYLDFGSPALRKTIHSIRIFVRPEGDLTLNVAVMYDWGDQDAINPSPYSATTTGTDAAVYGVALYGTDEYGGITVPAILTNIQGSGDSARFTFSTTGTEPSYSIQSLLPIFKTEGYR